MNRKQAIVDHTTAARRGFVKAAGIGGGLALAASATGALAAISGKPDTCVSLVPYFDVNEGKLDEFKALGPKFIALTRKEKGVLYYGFSFSGQAAHCREGYKDADAVLAHLKNVDAPLKQALSISKISRLEVHGPAAESRSCAARWQTLSRSTSRSRLVVFAAEQSGPKGWQLHRPATTCVRGRRQLCFRNFVTK